MVLLFDGGGHEVGAQVGRDAIKAAHVHNLHPVGARLCMVLSDGSRHPGHLSCSVERTLIIPPEQCQFYVPGLLLATSLRGNNESMMPLYCTYAEHVSGHRSERDSRCCMLPLCLVLYEQKLLHACF
jgi:hypothetical protein